MDKQTTLGFILIGLVLIVWMWLQAPPPHQIAPSHADSSRPPSTVERVLPKTPVIPEPPSKRFGKFFSHLTSGVERNLVVKTDLYTVELTTRGGLIRKWELREYKTWNQYPVHLTEYDSSGDFSLLFTSSDGKLVNTRHLYFRGDFPNWKTVDLKGEESFVVEMSLPISESKKIIKKFTFTNGKYSFDSDLRFVNVGDVVSNFEYQVVWEYGIPYAERNSIEESRFATAYAYSGGELTELDASSPGQTYEKELNTTTSWVATRNKYFAAAILAEEGKTQGAYMAGVHQPQPDQGARESYTIALKMPFGGSSSESAKFTVFLGPLDLDVVRSYGRGLDQIMSLGAAWIIRPISEYLLIPLFRFLRMFIPNFGVVIIVFSIIIKIVLHPLTRASMRSMKKMQALQPLMNEIREKHKDDPQKMNQQIMNLYRDYGVNPASGCLPLLLQLPILYALYTVFSSSIELRQASFVWWIKDLSAPDTIGTLPFTVPFFGISEVSGLALAMGITMFLQQKMTITDPRQKAMVWMMPIMMTLLFNSFPSGLNLYYFVFNILSIAQQTWINKQHKNEPLRKVDPKKKSGGLMERLTRDLPKVKR